MRREAPPTFLMKHSFDESLLLHADLICNISHVHQPGWKPEPHLLDKPHPEDTQALFPDTGSQEPV